MNSTHEIFEILLLSRPYLCPNTLMKFNTDRAEVFQKDRLFFLKGRREIIRFVDFDLQIQNQFRSLKISVINQTYDATSSSLL